MQRVLFFLLNVLHVLFLSLSAKVEKDLSKRQAVFTEVIRIEYAYIPVVPHEAVPEVSKK